DLACGGRHVRIYTGADAREHRRAQRRRLLHARHADREPQHVGHDALPKLSLRRTAGENRTVDRFAGYLFDDAEVAERDVRRRFPGSAWQTLRSLAFGSITASPRPIVCCQKVPPMTVKLPGSTTPIPTRPSCVSAPPTTTGVPAFKPVSAAAAAVTCPATVPGSSTRGKMSGFIPQMSMISGDH